MVVVEEVAEVTAKEDLEAVGVAMAVEVGVMEVVVTIMAEHLLGTHSRYRECSFEVYVRIIDVVCRDTAL